MDYATFESRLIELMFKSDARITPPLVAYRVGCTVDTARQHLEEMARKGVVTMEVDDRGLVFFDLPGRPAPTHEPLSWAGASPAPLAAASMQPLYAPPDPLAGGYAQQIAYGHPGAPVPVQVQINNVPAPQIVVVGQPKSVVLAFLAALLLGPLGMLYATVGGALLMFVLNVVVAGATAGVGLVVTIPLGAIWAASAASQHNTRLGRAHA